MNLTKEQLDTLQHAIGADQYGRRQPRDRNFYGTDQAGKDGQVCESLVGLGLMWSRGFYPLYQEHVYHATDTGINAVLKHSPSPPKVSRSAARYQAFLDEDPSMTFGEWLKCQKHRNHDRQFAMDRW